jgi:hypothetical protein
MPRAAGPRHDGAHVNDAQRVLRCSYVRSGGHSERTAPCRRAPSRDHVPHPNDRPDVPAASRFAARRLASWGSSRCTGASGDGQTGPCDSTGRPIRGCALLSRFPKPTTKTAERTPIDEIPVAELVESYLEACSDGISEQGGDSGRRRVWGARHLVVAQRILGHSRESARELRTFQPAAPSPRCHRGWVGCRGRAGSPRPRCAALRQEAANSASLAKRCAIDRITTGRSTPEGANRTCRQLCRPNVAEPHALI